MISQSPSSIHKKEMMSVGFEVRNSGANGRTTNLKVSPCKAVGIIDLESDTEKEEEEPSDAVVNPNEIKETSCSTEISGEIKHDEIIEKEDAEKETEKEEEETIRGEGAKTEGVQTESECSSKVTRRGLILLSSDEDEDTDNADNQNIRSVTCRRSQRVRNSTLRSGNDVSWSREGGMESLKKAREAKNNTDEPSGRRNLLKNQCQVAITTINPTLCDESNVKISIREVKGEGDFSPTQGTSDDMISRKRTLADQIDSLNPRKIRKVGNAEDVFHSIHSSAEIEQEYEESLPSSSSISSSLSEGIHKVTVKKDEYNAGYPCEEEKCAKNDREIPSCSSSSLSSQCKDNHTATIGIGEGDSGEVFEEKGEAVPSVTLSSSSFVTKTCREIIGDEITEKKKIELSDIKICENTCKDIISVRTEETSIEVSQANAFKNTRRRDMANAKQGKIEFPVRKILYNKCRDIIKNKKEDPERYSLNKTPSNFVSKSCRDIVAEKTQMIETLVQTQFVPGREITGCDASKKVKEVLRLFNSYYLRFVQEEEVRCRKEATAVIKNTDKNERAKSRRPDLKAITHMRADKKMVDRGKVIGNVPGVKIGDQFFSRCEMIAIGLHCHWLGGIDTIPAAFKNKLNIAKLPVASSIMLSGAYEDDVDNSEDVIYTGQGGNDLLGNKRQIADQVLKRGNLALKNNMEQDIPVRLIRGHKTKNSYTGKVYTYDGLYKVKDYWAEKGISGFTVYKFRLKRLEGQPILTTDQVQFVSRQIPARASELKGLVCGDISNGLEPIPIPASNLFNPPVAPDFRYISKLEVKEGVRKPSPAKGCNCKGECLDPNKCSCAILNKKRFPYVMKDGGRLIEPMDVVYECGPHCGCSTNCSNRVTQKGMQYRLEVFQTSNKGWGVRSWDTIPAGAPVCQYAGTLMRTEDADNISDSQFIFELDCLQTIKGIGVRQKRSVSNAADIGAPKGALDNVPEQPEFCIDAGTCGNVSRMINHSCEPNLFVQCVLNDHHDLSQPRIWFFAADTISPLQELTYDYGYELGSVVKDGKVKSLPCYCGSFGCRKRLY